MCIKIQMMYVLKFVTYKWLMWHIMAVTRGRDQAQMIGPLVAYLSNLTNLTSLTSTWHQSFIYFQLKKLHPSWLWIFLRKFILLIHLIHFKKDFMGKKTIMLFKKKSLFSWCTLSFNLEHFGIIWAFHLLDLKWGRATWIIVQSLSRLTFCMSGSTSRECLLLSAEACHIYRWPYF